MAARWARQRAPVASAHGRPSDFPRASSCLRERPCAIDLAERGQRLDLVGEELHHARFAEAERSDRLGEAAQVGNARPGSRPRDSAMNPRTESTCETTGTFPVCSHRASASAREFPGLGYLAPVGADQGQGVQRRGPHGLLAALVGHPAALQRVFLGGIPVPGPALELAEVVQQERQRCLVPAVERVPVLAGQHRPRLVQPVAPFEDQALLPGTGRSSGRRPIGSSPAARVERLGSVEQVKPCAVALEELEDGDAGQRVRHQARIGRLLGRAQRRLRPVQGGGKVPGYHAG